MHTHDPRCQIGLPQWQHPDWHPDRPDGLRALERYARHCASVEGNTSFYGEPKAASLVKWRAAVPPGFSFCFKFPRAISHAPDLHRQGDAAAGFAERLQAALGDQLGVLWLQLSDRVGPDQLPAIRAVLAALPEGLDVGVEVRHPALFAKDDAERRFNAMLIEQDANRVIFDTRILFAHRAADPATLEAWRQKPRVPLHVIATGDRPMVRFIAPMDIALADTAIAQWAEKLQQWIQAGKRPVFFCHTPDNRESPVLAARLARALHARLPDYCPAPDWPALAPPAAEQGALF